LAKYDLVATLCPICGDTAGTNESRINKQLIASQHYAQQLEQEIERLKNDKRS
jgi:hypothetical protein